MKDYIGSGNSGVSGYEFRGNNIIWRFKDGRTYLYSYKKPGKFHVENMRRLAESGKGLTTYVNKNVRDNYDGKL